MGMKWDFSGIPKDVDPDGSFVFTLCNGNKMDPSEFIRMTILETAKHWDIVKFMAFGAGENDPMHLHKGQNIQWSRFPMMYSASRAAGMDSGLDNRDSARKVADQVFDNILSSRAYTRPIVFSDFTDDGRLNPQSFISPISGTFSPSITTSSTPPSMDGIRADFDPVNQRIVYTNVDTGDVWTSSFTLSEFMNDQFEQPTYSAPKDPEPSLPKRNPVVPTWFLEGQGVVVCQ